MNGGHLDSQDGEERRQSYVWAMRNGKQKIMIKRTQKEDNSPIRSGSLGCCVKNNHFELKII
jgi:hypothetical protein